VECPRCRIELRRPDGRDAWSCSRCAGIFVSVGDLVDQLVNVAPDLVAHSEGRSLTTLGRRTVAPPLACPQCAAPMDPVFVGGVEADRCYHDEHVWFDASELEIVVDRAREQHAMRHPSLMARLRAALLD
jgi:Zn-finger nucleic acid-binding protein